MTRFFTALFMCAAASLASPAMAKTPGQDMGQAWMDEFGMTRPPVGYIRMCRQAPEWCDEQRSDRSGQVVVLGEADLAELTEINLEVNRTVTPVTDLDLYGEMEVWTFPSGYGDCEDYVLLKRHMLIERGWPAEVLMITVVRQSNGEGHAVLTVATDQGDLILDNQTDAILPWHATDYAYEKRQSPMASGAWVWLRTDRPGAQMPEVAASYGSAHR
ncbi:MAG: transglutaminase-like cysteine peptidase [Pseudomonadota bacterium]